MSLTEIKNQVLALSGMDTAGVKEDLESKGYGKLNMSLKSSWELALMLYTPAVEESTVEESEELEIPVCEDSEDEEFSDPEENIQGDLFPEDFIHLAIVPTMETAIYQEEIYQGELMGESRLALSEIPRVNIFPTHEAIAPYRKPRVGDPIEGILVLGILGVIVLTCLAILACYVVIGVAIWITLGMIFKGIIRYRDRSVVRSLAGKSLERKLLAA